MESTFDFRLVYPDGPISDYVQAIWFASVSAFGDPIKKPLLSDGGTGVFLNLEGTIYFNGKAYLPGAFWTPVNREAESIVLAPGCRLLGFRFHPAIKLSALGLHKGSVSGDVLSEVESQETDELFTDIDALPIVLHSLIDDLISSYDPDEQMNTLAIWLSQNIKSSHLPPSALTQAIAAIDPTGDLQGIERFIPFSMRQLERQFKTWVGMTPKHYQRLLRVKAAIETIKQTPSINLAELAVESGFSDQAHMTREFRQLAKITPRQYQQEKI